MKKTLTFAVMAIMLVLAASCSQYKYESVKGDPTAARIYTLDNGLKVYMIVNKDEPRIEAQVAVKVGAKNDPQETTGLAHYFEHLMFKGTQQFGTQNYELEKPMLDQIEALFETYRTTTDKAQRAAIYHEIDSISLEASKLSIPNEYDKLMAAIGASGTNAYTSNDVTCYVENIPSNQIENWAKIQADRFENVVLRGFHTELETIYEEYNMYSAMDQEKIFDALNGALFENHPYHTPVIGWPEHLKNPSVTNVKNYHDYWYVPNNMAVCLVGDFNPDEAIKIVDKYFGSMKPNEELKKMEFEPEKPIDGPIVKDVEGLESPSVWMAWRFGGANSPDALYLQLLEKVLSNGVAGLIDIDVNQQQKTLGMGSGLMDFADYSAFLVVGNPKAGQSLDEVAAIALEEIGKVKKGEFSDELLTAIMNNMKLDFARQIESPRYLVRAQVNSFIDDIKWEDYINTEKRISAITKEDFVAFVNANFTDKNYVRVNKHEVKTLPDTRIDKPAITPIYTNRDTASQFLKNIQNSQVKPIAPVFVNYEKDMKVLSAKSDIPVLYKQNKASDLFELDFQFEYGSYNDNLMSMVGDYSNYIGTSTMTPEEVKMAFYSLACNVRFIVQGDQTYISLSGLGENMTAALELLENVVADAQPNPEALQKMKLNTIEERRTNKLDQRANNRALKQYVRYGAEGPASKILSNDELMKVTDEQLIEKIHNIFNKEHRVFYYGPMASGKFVELINAKHNCPEKLETVIGGNPFFDKLTGTNTVVLAPYDANQVMLSSISNVGETYSLESDPIISLYNEYFGGGMNTIVFQEMREARGLAYSAWANMFMAEDPQHNNYFMEYIATQNDKVIDALKAFEEITENMPASEKAFNIAKESILGNLRTSRTIKSDVLWSYYNNVIKLGLDHDPAKDRFEKIADFTLDDVVKYQQEHIKDRPYSIAILGREKDLDLKELAKFGEIKRVTTDEIFGY